MSSEPDREATLQAYLQAWRDRKEAPDDLSARRSRLLDLYAAAYDELNEPGTDADYDQRLRVLWDLCGVAHNTTIPPELVKQSVEWEEPEIPTDVPAGRVAAVDARDHPVRARLSGLPEVTLRLLETVMQDAGQDVSFADYVSAEVRQVYLTPQLVDWSPSAPMEVCGSSEPLGRILILVSVGYVDLSPKPDWSLAMVAVHEAAHIKWFHRPEVSEDPRLLLRVPNEREAWRLTAQFLRGLLNTRSPAVEGYVQNHGEAIREALKRARGQVREANAVLGLPAGDMTLRLEVPAEISETALRGRGEVAAVQDQ